MLFGVMVKEKGDFARLDQIEARLLADGRIEGRTIKKSPAFFASLKPDLRSPNMAIQSQTFECGISGVWQGEIYNQAEFLSFQGSVTDRYELDNSDVNLFANRFASEGVAFVKMLNGRFAFAAMHDGEQEVTLGRDHLGIETLYVYEDQNMYVFSTKIQAILDCPGVVKELNFDALRRSLVFSYNPAWDTLFRGVRKVQPGSLVVLGANGITEKPYWYLSFKDIQEKAEADIAQELRELFADAVRLRMQKSQLPGIFVSGGLDSSGVACLMRQSSSSPIPSFSYRTLQVSYDESAFARIVADACQFDHHEVIYRPEDVKLIETIVQIEDEPFCNLGITVASFLLGREAGGLASEVYSGHGGDELFAGHPVYSADKIAAFTDRIPGAIKSPVASLFRLLPDSDKKLNLTVKLKRFSESLAYPKEFGTYRWRIYYGNDELNRLFKPDLAIDQHQYLNLFSDVLRMYQDADGKDPLSRSLFVDFKTEVSFHLRRMDLVRYFGVKPIFPMLDYRLVESAATVPASLKIKGYSDTKYIEKPVLAGVIPDQILNRHDKLGHSIPFKNWLRSDPVVKGFVQEVLSDRKIESRGLFNHTTIQTMWDNHQNARQNNSHRLWMLTVLELWLVANGF
jgi:asparagine synthase (glutamine-hydrolysing)